jgi:hypothetical protein
MMTALRTAVSVVLWCALILFAMGFVPTLNNRAHKNDFAVYYVAAVEWRDGIDPYTHNFANIANRNGLDIKDVRKSTEPPPFLLLFAPLVHFPVQTAFWVWQTINFLSLSVALILLLGPGSGLSRPAIWTLAALAFTYPPVLSHFWYGQSKLPILLMLVMMTRLMAQGFEGTAGLLLAIAGLLRLYPFAIAGYLVLQRRWRVLAYMAVGVAAGSAILAVVCPNYCLSFFRALSYLTSDQWISKSGDNAPFAFATRLIHHLVLPDIASGFVQRALLPVIDLLLLIFTVRATLARPAHDDIDLRLFALWIVTALLLPPVSWDYDMTLLLLPFAVLAAAASRAKAGRRAILMALASYLLIGIWRFSGIGDAQHVTGIGHNLLKETASLALLAAYLSAYWLAVDQPGTVRVPIRAMPPEIWRRLMPAT